MSTEPPSLAARLEQTGPLTWREAARLTARLARVLDRVHAQRPAHGGIEPLTVLFVGGTVRLADALPPESRHAAFVDPRHAADAPPDRQSDFYALGRTMAAMVAVDPQGPGEVSPDRLPPPLAAVQHRLVAAEPTVAYRSGNDIAAALELAIAASEGFAEPTPSPAAELSLARSPLAPTDVSAPFGSAPGAPDLPAMAPLADVRRPPRRRPRLALGLAVVLVAGGLAALWLWPGSEVGVEPPAVAGDPAPVSPPAVVAEAEPVPAAVTDQGDLDAATELPLEQVLAALPDLPLAAPPTRPSTRAAVAELLADLKAHPCTRLEVEPTALGLRLVGSTASAGVRTELLARIGRLDDIDKVSLALDETGGFCRLYDMLAAHAEPSLPRLADLFPSRPDYRLAAGEPLVLRVLTPPAPLHLVVDYFTADGMVVHLSAPQPETAPLPPAEEVWIGDPADGQWLTITEPFGPELILVIASETALFEAPRPMIEPADVYLELLEAALAGQARKPEASTIAIRTVPASP